MTTGPSAVIGALIANLDAESEELDGLVAGLDETGWRTPTPAVGWDVATSVAHLAASDCAGLVALAGGDVLATLADVVTPTWTASTGQLLETWRTQRAELARALAAVPPGVRIPWFGPPMGAASFITARLMETWAHGQDIADALRVRREPTPRLRHIADLGVRTLGWSFNTRGMEVPVAPISVSLTAPDGSTWEWGPSEAADSLTGTAVDFALLVTQRRHRDDLALIAHGATADTWLSIAQAFAGPAGTGRLPLSA